jgi:hypothetical protein
VAHEHIDTPHELTFDEELLLWLGDETPQVRAADSERVHDIAAEFARGFDALSPVRRAVTVFGSARTPREHPTTSSCTSWGRVSAAPATRSSPAAAQG